MLKYGKTEVIDLKKIYLAGFDVFSDDALERGKKMKELCARYGFEGLYPLDNECSGAEGIFRANTELIRKCDIIAANVNPFRGHEPDSGTAFEIGYACALGKIIYCYAADMSTLRERLGAFDNEGYAVEDFGLPCNLMISVPAKMVKGNFEDCIKIIAKQC